MATVDLNTFLDVSEKYRRVMTNVVRFATWYDSQSNEKITMPMEHLFEIFIGVYPYDTPSVIVKNKVTFVGLKWEGHSYTIKHDLLLGDSIHRDGRYTIIQYPFNMKEIAAKWQ